MAAAPPSKRQKIETPGASKSFSMDPLTRFGGPCAIIKQPVEIACFSYNKQRDMLHDASSMKYYYPSKLNEDLEGGFDQFVKFDEIDEHLNSLLASLQRYEEMNGKTIQVDVVTWRGMMTKIMTVSPKSFNSEMYTPYLRNDGWSMNAFLFKDTIYIEEDVDFESRRASSRQHALAMYAGYKFEEVSTLEKTWDESTRDEIERRNENIVDNVQQYCSIVKTQLGSSSLIMGGEVDCLWDYKPEPPENPVPHYLELKTSRELTTERSVANFEHQKLLKFWAQSLLLGVPRIIVGFRSERNILVSTQMLDTMKIPAQVRERERATWDGNVCINFAVKFLEFLRETVTEGQLFGLKFVKGGHSIEVAPKDGKPFLTEEYVQWKSR